MILVVVDFILLYLEWYYFEGDAKELLENVNELYQERIKANSIPRRIRFVLIPFTRRNVKLVTKPDERTVIARLNQDWYLEEVFKRGIRIDIDEAMNRKKLLILQTGEEFDLNEIKEKELDYISNFIFECSRFNRF